MSGVAMYSVIVVPDETVDGEPCYIAYHPELDGCMSHGVTPEEARVNLRYARELYIKTLQEMGEPVPPPSGTETEIVWKNFSGAPTEVSIRVSMAILPSASLIPAPLR